MFRIHCKNAISEEGLQSLLPNFTLTERQEEADGILVRSADMHEEKLGEATLAVARAGPGSTTFRWSVLRRKAWWSLIRPVQMQTA